MVSILTSHSHGRDKKRRENIVKILGHSCDTTRQTDVVVTKCTAFHRNWTPVFYSLKPAIRAPIPNVLLYRLLVIALLGAYLTMPSPQLAQLLIHHSSSSFSNTHHSSFTPASASFTLKFQPFSATDSIANCPASCFLAVTRQYRLRWLHYGILTFEGRTPEIVSGGVFELVWVGGGNRSVIHQHENFLVLHLSVQIGNMIITTKTK